MGPDVASTEREAGAPGASPEPAKRAPMTVGVVAVGLHGVTKRFGEDVIAVRDLDLEVRDGEFFSLLGPSGCGKTTTLRIIAGLDYPTDGSVQIYGEEMGLKPPNKRPVNTVFQSYALFPHMNVEDNVSFGLRMQNVDQAEVRRRTGEAIELVRLSGMEKRRPKALSGGEQQRVALARALVNQPKVLLLDEPLGALDLKLRQAMQLELKDIQHEVGISFVYVTHDQEEALTMSDRIGVMNEGELVQVGRSEDIYESPANLFVAGFVGDMVFLPGEIAATGAVRLKGGEIVQARTTAAPGTSITLAIRPEMLYLYGERSEAPSGRNAVAGTVTRRIFLGESLYYEIDIGVSGAFDVHVENVPSAKRWAVGDDVIVDFHLEAATAFAE